MPDTSSTSPTAETADTSTSSSRMPSPVVSRLPSPPDISDPERFILWCRVKAGDDRRILEEEKTRQEYLKLEQRKIELTMLKETLYAGVHPQAVPTMLSNVPGTNVSRSSGRDSQWMHQTQQAQPYNQQNRAAETSSAYYGVQPNNQVMMPYWAYVAYPGLPDLQPSTSGVNNPQPAPRGTVAQTQSLATTVEAPSSSSQQDQNAPTRPYRPRVPSFPTVTQNPRDVPILSVERPEPSNLIHILPSFEEVSASAARQAHHARSRELGTIGQYERNASTR